MANLPDIDLREHEHCGQATRFVNKHSKAHRLFAIRKMLIFDMLVFEAAAPQG